jgi:hypothetical protein
MKKILFTLIVIASLSSCGHSESVNANEEPKAMAELTLFFPDGTKETIVVSDYISYSSSVDIYYTTMDGVEYQSSLPYIMKLL